MLTLGPHRLRNLVALAPMAGVTDVPFRQLAWRLGVGYMVGEMTGSRPELAQTRKTLLRREAVAGALHAVQIAGTEELWIADATRQAIEQGAAVVDINFGCPAKKVCRKAAGSALMAQPQRLLELTKSALDAAEGSDAVVTVKMRTGPDPQNRNAVDLALRLQDAGIQGLAIHGRTRADKFNGFAEFDTIAQVVAELDIAVFANGDIATPDDARRVLAHTNADAVMIGRAALGAPWLPTWVAQELAGRDYKLPDFSQRLEWLMEQLLATHSFYGEQQGVRIARKHIQWTLRHQTLELLEPLDCEHLARSLVRADSASEQIDLLSQAFELRAA